MKTTMFYEHSLSQFMLGMVQLNQPGGGAQKTETPPYQAVLRILEYALEHGVNCLDMSAAGAGHEELIGRALQELAVDGRMFVVSKVAAMDENLQPAQADYVVEQSVVSSLQRLGLDVLPLCLFENEHNTVYVDSLLKMKEKGLVAHIGLAVNSPEWALQAIRSGNFEAMRVPTSVLDLRYHRRGILIEAKRQGMVLFVRNGGWPDQAFLPGPEIPGQPAPLVEVRRRLEKIAAETGLSLGELAVRFVIGLEGADCLVMELKTLEQLQADLKVFAKGALNPGLMRAILEAIPANPAKT